MKRHHANYPTLRSLLIQLIPLVSSHSAALISWHIILMCWGGGIVNRPNFHLIVTSSPPPHLAIIFELMPITETRIVEQTVSGSRCWKVGGCGGGRLCKFSSDCFSVLSEKLCGNSPQTLCLEWCPQQTQNPHNGC